jgi:hypothetical protein
MTPTPEQIKATRIAEYAELGVIYEPLCDWNDEPQFSVIPVDGVQIFRRNNDALLVRVE